MNAFQRQFNNDATVIALTVPNKFRIREPFTRNINITPRSLCDILPHEILPNIYSYAGLFESDDCDIPVEDLNAIDKLFEDREFDKYDHEGMTIYTYGNDNYSVRDCYVISRYYQNCVLWMLHNKNRIYYLETIGLVSKNGADKLKDVIRISSSSWRYVPAIMHLHFNPKWITMVNDYDNIDNILGLDSLYEYTYLWYCNGISNNFLIKIISDTTICNEVKSVLNMHDEFIGSAKYDFNYDLYNVDAINNLHDITSGNGAKMRTQTESEKTLQLRDRSVVLRHLLVDYLPLTVLTKMVKELPKSMLCRMVTTYDDVDLRIKICSALINMMDTNGHINIPDKVLDCYKEISYISSVVELLLIKNNITPVLTEKMLDPFVEVITGDYSYGMIGQYERLIINSHPRILTLLKAKLYNKNKISWPIIDKYADMKSYKSWEQAKSESNDASSGTSIYNDYYYSKHDENLSTNVSNMASNLASSRNNLHCSSDELVTFLLENPGTTFSMDEVQSVLERVSDDSTVELILSLVNIV